VGGQRLTDLLAGQGRASIASLRTPASCAARIMRMPVSRVRMQRARPSCASLAITTGACPNPVRTSSSTEHQPSTTATSTFTMPEQWGKPHW
jgi:hypothetical protein